MIWVASRPHFSIKWVVLRKYTAVLLHSVVVVLWHFSFHRVYEALSEPFVFVNNEIFISVNIFHHHYCIIHSLGMSVATIHYNAEVLLHCIIGCGPTNPLTCHYVRLIHGFLLLFDSESHRLLQWCGWGRPLLDLFVVEGFLPLVEKGAVRFIELWLDVVMMLFRLGAGLQRANPTNATQVAKPSLVACLVSCNG